MTIQDIEAFLREPAEKRLALARDPANASVLTAYLGDAGYREYAALAGKLDTIHLGVSAPKNLIFVPGVMGSLLHSTTKGGVWWIDARTRDHINDLGLSDDGQQDADPNNGIEPFSTDPSYEPFNLAVLNRDDFGHVLFPYDWRKPLSNSAASLRDLVSGFHAKNGGQPVHLVAHSMGGLMVRTTLMEHGNEIWPKIGRIVFIGTPHYGSPAIAGYLKNHLWGFELLALLGLYLSPETLRTFWGVLGMLPAPRGIYPGTRPDDCDPWTSDNADDTYIHPCANFDMYRADEWKLEISAEETARLQRILDGAVEFHRRMYETHKALDPNLRDKMAVIAGVGSKTLFRLAYEQRFFGMWDHTEKVTDRIAGAPNRDGDGRVPLASAALDGVRIRYVKGVHGGLPNIPAVQKAVFEWLNEEPMSLPATVHEALSVHLAPGEDQSAAPNLDGTARKVQFSDDPGLWDMSAPNPAELDALKAKLKAEQLPEFTRVRIL